MLLAFSVYPYEILQLSFLIQQNIKLRLVGKNKIKRNELLKPRLPVYGYPRTYASVLLIMIIIAGTWHVRTFVIIIRNV